MHSLPLKLSSVEGPEGDIFLHGHILSFVMAFRAIHKFRPRLPQLIIGLASALGVVLVRLLKATTYLRPVVGVL